MVTFLGITEKMLPIITDEDFYVVYKRREYLVLGDIDLIEKLKSLPKRGFIPFFSDIKPYLIENKIEWEFIGKGTKL